jgi:ABC-type transport system substrate-binding protein
VIYRDYHSAGNTSGEQAYPDPRIDRVGEAQRREFDPQKRIELVKEFQYLAAELMPLVPFVHLYTEFRFRWPWLRNSNHGYPKDAGLPTGHPVLGGQRQWLDPSMPNRETGAL